ncbi:MAG TPA: UMP kinase [Gammaproteobacteria bacterium]|nr:UMP kinase [Gammaproteobacteria bacterium]
MESAAAQPKYKRILLKLSGEALQGDNFNGIDANKLARITQEVASVTSLGVQVAMVVGGGNLIRGADLSASGIDRVACDQMGMLSTVINGIALRNAMARNSISATLMSAIPMLGMAEPFDHVIAKERLTKGKVVIFAGGTGNPLVTTDSAAALRGFEIEADIVLKATKVDAVFSDDPIKNPQAKRYSHLTYDEVLEKELRVMDLNSILLCRDNNLAIRVFNMNKEGALQRIILGDDVGTLINNG